MFTIKKSLLSLTLIALLVLTGAAFAQDDMVELTLSIGPRGFGDAAPILIEQCEEQLGNVTVEWDRISDVPNESRSVYVTNFTARNNNPDIVAVDVIWPGDFAQRGWIASLSDYFTEEELAEYQSGFAAAANINGEQYAIRFTLTAFTCSTAQTC